MQGNDFFLEKVTGWQRRLGAVDSVLSTWMDVQKKWQALESIFIGSADIRVQLPDDSRRFDIINANFQVLSLRCVNPSVLSIQVHMPARKSEARHLLNDAIFAMCNIF